MNAQEPRERPLPVPDDLRSWVARIDVTAYAAYDGARPLIHAPDPATTLVWRTTAEGHSAVLVTGPRTHAAYHDAKDIPACARFRLGLGSAPALLGVPAGELVDQAVPLSRLWGPYGDRLAEALAALGPRADGAGAAVELIAAALRSRVQEWRDRGSAARSRSRADLVRRAAAGLAPGYGAGGGAGGTYARVADVARQMGVSERHLRGVFTAAVGVPPKQFVGLNRIRTVLSNARREPWARLASHVGYYDQSHMTAHFRELMHVTPGAFAAGRLPTVRC